MCMCVCDVYVCVCVMCDVHAIVHARTDMYCELNAIPPFQVWCMVSVPTMYSISIQTM